MKQKKIDMARQLELAGILNETQEKTPDNILLSHLAANGKWYAIVKENGAYYVKQSISGLTKESKDNLKLEHFDYIGGLQHKLDEKFTSYAMATKRLNLKLIEIAKVQGKTFTGNVLLNEQYGEDENDNENSTEGGDEFEKEPTQDAMPGDDIDSQESAPEGGDEMENEPEGTSGEAQGDEFSDDESGSGEADAGEEGGTGEDNVNSEGETVAEVVGKLSQQLSQFDEFSANETKNALNSIITVLRPGLEQLDENEIEKLILRIRKKGEKLDEEGIDIMSKLEEIDRQLQESMDEEEKYDTASDVASDTKDDKDNPFDTNAKEKPIVDSKKADSSKIKLEIGNATINVNESIMKKLTDDVIKLNLNGKRVQSSNKLLQKIQEDYDKHIKKIKYENLKSKILESVKKGVKIDTSKEIVKQIFEQLKKEKLIK